MTVCVYRLWRLDQRGGSTRPVFGGFRAQTRYKAASVAGSDYTIVYVVEGSEEEPATGNTTDFLMCDFT